MNDVRSYPQMNLRLPPDLKEWIQIQAIKERRSVTSWLTLLIEKERAATKENGHTTGNLGG